MMTAKFNERAVALTVDLLRKNLQTIEPKPNDIIPSDVPLDNRSPLVQVFSQGGRWLSQRDGLVLCELEIAVSITAETPERAEQFINRYISAILLIFAQNPTFDNSVVNAQITDWSSASRGDVSQTRKVVVFGLSIHLQEEV